MISFITPSWVELPKIYIELDKIQAKTSYKQLRQTLGMNSTGYYTDRSEINQKVGVAIVHLSQRFSNISVFLGSNIYYTV